jgi:hypothetical protein
MTTCLHDVISCGAKVRKVALDPMNVVVTSLPEPPAVAKGHQRVVGFFAPVALDAEVAPRSPVLEMVQRDSSPRSARCALTVVPGVVTPLSNRPLFGAVVTANPGRVSHLRAGSLARLCAADLQPAFTALCDRRATRLAIAAASNERVLGPRHHYELGTAVRTLLGRKSHKGHWRKRRRLDFDGLAWQDRYGFGGHDTGRLRS